MQYMYVKPFSVFLVDHFISWAEEKCEAGRYQLRSPSFDSSVELYNALVNHDRVTGLFECRGEELKYISCNDINIIPVLHNDFEGDGYSENYISFLRDEVSSQKGLFEKTALLIIHNSLLDTLINSAKDISNDERVFSPIEIKKSLVNLVDEKDSPNGEKVSRILLDYQYDLIVEDKGSMFGFRALYDAISDGDIRFHEIGLLEDPAILNMSGNDDQIRKRLDSNQKLHDQIQGVLEHYPDQLEDNLPDFSEKFIKENFNDDEKWKSLTYDEFRKEQENNRDQALLLVDESSISSDIYIRTKSDSKSVQKERHILLVVGKNNDNFDLEIKFEGSNVNLDQVNLKDKGKVLSKTKNLALKGGIKNTAITITGAVPKEPMYFDLSLNRPKTSEKFKFKCLVIKEGAFNVDGFKNTYLINPAKQIVILQSQETELDIGLSGINKKSIVEQAGQDFDLTEVGIIDFEAFSNEVDTISFKVSHGVQSLKFVIEGAAATDNLVLPLIFDQSRKSKLFKSGFNGTFNTTKRKVYIENREVKSISGLTFLEMEAKLLDSELVFEDERNKLKLSLDTLSELSQELQGGYQALFSYYKLNNTLPSLSGWDKEYCKIVEKIVTSYHKYLSSINEKETLDKDQKSILNIGFYITAENEYITPLHPLVLSYYLKLVTDINSDIDRSFFDLPKVTLNRLNPQGLLPIIFDAHHNYSHVLSVDENCFWLKCVPQISTNYSYITKLVNDKVEEFTAAFKILFDGDKSAETLPTLIINSVNNRNNHELFLGIVNQISRQVSKRKEPRFNVHVNVYDDELMATEFDVFSELASYDAIKTAYGLNKGKNKDHADSIVDLMRKRVTYSKFTHIKTNKQAYAHLTFFRNNEKVKVVNVNPDEKLSGITCSGLINGEASSAEKDNYITGFGSKNVEYKGIQHIEIAVLLGRLMKPARDNTTDYRDNSAIALAVNSGFKDLLDKSYDSSIWTSIIDPKVTLDFFDNQENTLLIHYSDQYTSSASYDAITVTKQTDLYDKVLEKEDAGRIEEFNAFNGEWLLKMITDGSNLRKERKGILTAYKLISCLLAKSSIIWVPMSAAEVVRVSGNIGLNMTESEFSRHIQGYKAGAISDDVLFVGFKNGIMYLLPLEVKTGAGYDKAKAIKQALELGRYLGEELLTGRALSNKLYRSLFVRQVLMQIEKYELYSVYPKGYFDEFLSEKETWLIGDYEIGKLTDYAKGFVVANLEGHKCLETSITTIDDINVLEVPSSFMPKTINTPLIELLENTKSSAIAKVQDKYYLTDECINDGGPVNPKPEIKIVPPILVKAPTDTLKVLIGHEVKHDQPVYWEPTNTAKFMNTNSGIIGTMGTGKTQCTKSVVTQLYREQHNNVNGEPIGMLIFDYKSDYVDENFLEATAAKKYNLHKLPYNPLSLFGSTPMLPVHTGRGFTETMGKAFGLGQKQQLKLRKLVGEAYELAGISKSDSTTWTKPAPTISDVWALFINQEKVEEDSLYAALESLYELEVFEDDVTKCTSLFDLIDGIRVIELAGYPPQIQNLVVALTLDLFYSQMQKQGKPEVQGDFRQVNKLLLVDEADNFMSQNFPSLRKVLKEGREYGVGVILSTQDITHFKTGENDYSTYILSWVVHRVSQIKNQDIKSIFNIDEKNDQDNLMNIIRGLDKHYSLYVNGDKRVQKIKDKAFWELV